MPTITRVKNILSECRAQDSGDHVSTIPEMAQVKFEPYKLTKLELDHARGLMRESFWRLIHIANRMNEKFISYKLAYLELRSEGIV